jgi:hypothetical protein
VLDLSVRACLDQLQTAVLQSAFQIERRLRERLGCGRGGWLGTLGCLCWLLWRQRVVAAVFVEHPRGFIHGLSGAGGFLAAASLLRACRCGNRGFLAASGPFPSIPSIAATAAASAALSVSALPVRALCVLHARGPLALSHSRAGFLSRGQRLSMLKLAAPFRFMGVLFAAVRVAARFIASVPPAWFGGLSRAIWTRASLRALLARPLASLRTALRPSGPFRPVRAIAAFGSLATRGAFGPLAAL